MAKNPDISKLGPSYINKRTFDSANDAVRVSFPSNTNFDFSLDTTDAVQSVNAQATPVSGSQTVGQVASTIVIAEQTCVFNRTVSLYSLSDVGTTVAGSVKVQVSPADSGTQWVDLGLSLASSTTGAGTLTVSTAMLARRIRVVSVVAPTGAAVAYTILLGN